MPDDDEDGGGDSDDSDSDVEECAPSEDDDGPELPLPPSEDIKVRPPASRGVEAWSLLRPTSASA